MEPTTAGPEAADQRSKGKTGSLFKDDIGVAAVGRLSETPRGQVSIIHHFVKPLHDGGVGSRREQGDTGIGIAVRAFPVVVATQWRRIDPSVQREVGLHARPTGRW